jgi:hypothetical protein
MILYPASSQYDFRVISRSKVRLVRELYTPFPPPLHLLLSLVDRGQVKRNAACNRARWSARISQKDSTIFFRQFNYSIQPYRWYPVFVNFTVAITPFHRFTLFAAPRRSCLFPSSTVKLKMAHQMALMEVNSLLIKIFLYR